MGLRASPVAQIVFDDARVPADRLIGEEGTGFRTAMEALDAGRLGIAACAVGLAQGALDYATPVCQANGSSSAGGSWTSRGWGSCSPTWPRPSRRPGR